MNKNSELQRTSRGKGRKPFTPNLPDGTRSPVPTTAPLPTYPRATSALSPQYSTHNKVVAGGLAALGIAGMVYWNYGGHSSARKRRLNNID